ncbi:MAG: ABC transporter permease [Bacteroidales bacterium]
MNKISLIIKREYLTRVRKKSFLVLTLLGPIMIALLMFSPIIIDHFNKSTPKTIAVLDESKLYYDKFRTEDNYHFRYVFGDIDSQKDSISKGSGDYALLYIPKTQLNLPSKAALYSKAQIPFDLTSYISKTMSQEIENTKMAAIGIDPALRKSIKANVHIESYKLDDEGKESKSFNTVNYIIGIVSGLMVYFFIFFFGGQIMRGVLEEKTNRIVEVLVSSVKPFQLMMGKILGLSLVGLTQFVLWVILSFGVYQIAVTFVTPSNQSHLNISQIQNPQIQEAIDNAGGNSLTNQLIEIIDNLPILNLVLAFAFFFIFGYLIYAALFAAIGSAVDNDTDTQQFMLPIVIPLIISMVSLSSILNNPDSSLSYFLSLFPLTSPIVMLGRIPLGVPTWELILSMILLVLGFIGTTWFAAKIYRTGILMYGKKVNYKELWKWIRYKS